MNDIELSCFHQPLAMDQEALLRFQVVVIIQYRYRVVYDWQTEPCNYYLRRTIQLHHRYVEIESGKIVKTRE